MIDDDDSPTVIIWVTKWALTQGILKLDARDVGDGLMKIGSCLYVHDEGCEWHRTPQAAVARAEELRQKKVKSLEKALKVLRAKKIEAPE